MTANPLDPWDPPDPHETDTTRAETSSRLRAPGRPARRLALVALALLASAGFDRPAGARSDKLPQYNLVTHDLLERGAGVYYARCAVCHGETGLGDGPLAGLLEMRPRNHRSAPFRWGSSPAAIAETVALGRSSVMPAFYQALSNEEIWSVSLLVWSWRKNPDDSSTSRRELFSWAERMAEVWQERGEMQEPTPAIIPAKSDSLATAQLLKLGARVFDERCASCHGENGGGDGELAEYLPIRPRNYHDDAFRWGTSPPAIMVTVALGRSGVMPSFASALSAEEMWAVAHFVWEMIPPNRREGMPPMKAHENGGEVPASPASPADSTPPTHLTNPIQ